MNVTEASDVKTQLLPTLGEWACHACVTAGFASVSPKDFGFRSYLNHMSYILRPYYSTDFSLNR